MKDWRKRNFWNVTKNNLKSNLQCAFCKRENCPLKYRAESREKWMCDEEMNRRADKVINKKKLR